MGIEAVYTPALEMPQRESVHVRVYRSGRAGWCANFSVSLYGFHGSNDKVVGLTGWKSFAQYASEFDGVEWIVGARGQRDFGDEPPERAIESLERKNRRPPAELEQRAR